MGDQLDRITNSLTATIVAIVMLCSALVPIAVKQIANLTSVAGESADTYTPLISAVVIMAIVGVLIGVIKFYSKSDSDR